MLCDYRVDRRVGGVGAVRQIGEVEVDFVKIGGIFLLSTSSIYLTMYDLPNLWPFEELYNLAEDMNEDLPAAPQRWRNAPFQYTYNISWSLDDWADSNTLDLTRFTKPQIHELVVLLRLDEVEYNAGLKPHPVMACCVLLRRLAFSCRWCDIQELFGRSAGWLSTVFTCIIQHLHDTFGYLLDWHLRQYHSISVSLRGIDL
jgi:hypothetical protein